VVESKQQILQVPFSGIKIKKKANRILLSCGLNSLVIHSLSLAHATIVMAHTVLQLHVF